MKAVVSESESAASRTAAEIRHLVQINPAGTFSSISSTSSGMDGSSISDSVLSDNSPRPSEQDFTQGDAQLEERPVSVTFETSSFSSPPPPPSPPPGGVIEAENNLSVEDFQQPFYGEPEWQRASGRWPRWELGKLQEMKTLLGDDLRTAPPFPEVVGSRRMLRFLRGHKHDVQKASDMMRKMLRWRKENGVDAIRHDIIENKLFFPSQFPDGEMIMKLYPLLVASPLSVDFDGGPISYESYAFSPRKVAEHAGGNLDFFIKFHIYCQELKQICLDSMSDAKEMENLARIAAKHNSPPPKTAPSEASVGGPTPDSTSPLPPPRAGGGGSKTDELAGFSVHEEGQLDGSEVATDTVKERVRKTAETRSTSPLMEKTVGYSRSSVGKGDTLHSTGNGMTADPATSTRKEVRRKPLADGGLISGGGFGGSSNQEPMRGAQEEEKKQEDGAEEEPWGVVLRNTIIRDLAGFGMEHAGPIGRSLISKVLAVSQDNYPEMMARCYIINAPWVFYALWKGLAPLMSANTARKIQVLNYDFLPTLLRTMSIERLPKSARGRCEPMRLTKEQMHDFVICGWVSDEPVATKAETEAVDVGTADARREVSREQNGETMKRRDFEVEISDEEDDDDDANEAGGRGRGSAGFEALDLSEERSHYQHQVQHRDRHRRRSDLGRSHLGSSDLAGGRNFSDGGDGGVISRKPGAVVAGGPSSGLKQRRNTSFRGLFRRTSSRDGLDRKLLRGRAAPTLSRSSSLGDGPASAGGSKHGGATVGGSGSGARLAVPPRPRDSRLSPGRSRSYASPGPRGLRNQSAAVVFRSGTLRSRAVGELSPVEGASIHSQGEDFDGRLVDRALDLSISRKAQRLSRSNAAVATLLGDASSDTPSELSLEDREKAGWVRRKLRSLGDRRESRKLGVPERRGLEISAGDCADWVPNSERDFCLHCERPFTMLLRRHHCRMCGELVCAHCSPHRVRLTLGSYGEEGVGAPQEALGGSRRSRRKRGGFAVRVCTDCHFSLQTVNVASANSLEEPRGEAHGGEGDVAGGGLEAEHNLQGIARGMETVHRNAAAAAAAAVRVTSSDAGSGGGVRWSFAEDLEALYRETDEEIVGDVVLEDVLEWGLVQRRARRSWEVVLMCLVAVVEMHHAILLEAAAMTCRTLGHTVPALVHESARALSTHFTRGNSMTTTLTTTSIADPDQEQRRQQEGDTKDTSPASGKVSSVGGSGSYGAEAMLWTALDATLDRAPVSTASVILTAVLLWFISVWWRYHQ